MSGATFQTRGALACYIVETREFPQMLWGAEHGDRTAYALKAGVGLWKQVAFQPGARPQRCTTCDHVFTFDSEPEAFLLAIPIRGDGDSIVSGVCRRCVRRIGSESLLATAVTHFKRIWPHAQVTGAGLDSR